MATTRKEQAALAKKSIIETTETLIREKGYEDIRISDITSACGMTPGNFYHYFKSKDELFTQIDTNKYYASFNALDLNTELPVIERLVSYASHWVNVTIIYYGPNYCYNWTRHYTLKSQMQVPNGDKIDLIKKHIESILQDGVKKKELKEDIPVACVAYTMAYSLFGASVYYGLREDNVLYAKWMDDFCKVFIRQVLSSYICA